MKCKGADQADEGYPGTQLLQGLERRFYYGWKGSILQYV